MAQQQKIAVVEMRLVLETDFGNSKPSINHAMDEISKVLGRMNNVHVAFAFYDVETGKRLRTYGPFGASTTSMKQVMAVELSDSEDIPA